MPPGNDLSTPMPQYGFAGLLAGDQWCLCAARWLEAFEAGAAPAVVLEATHLPPWSGATWPTSGPTPSRRSS